jgi:uncharacterized protein YcbK (DUF882 family)
VSPADIKQVQTRLINIGIDRVELNGRIHVLKADGQLGPVTYAAVKVFKRGWALKWPKMNRYSSTPGKGFRSALKLSHERDGRCSLHVFFREWRSKGNGCISVHFKLVRGLERYRDLVGHPIRIVSGYRDPAYNRKIGGATQSQHMSGRAADLDPEVSLSQVRALRKFSGIGYMSGTNKVRHVDVRPTRTRLNPAVWMY